MKAGAHNNIEDVEIGVIKQKLFTIATESNDEKNGISAIKSIACCNI